MDVFAYKRTPGYAPALLIRCRIMQHKSQLKLTVGQCTVSAACCYFLFRENEKLSRINEKLTRENEKLSRENEKFSRENEI